MREVLWDRKLVLAMSLCIAIGLLDGFEVLVLGLMAPAIARDLNIALPFFTWIVLATSVGLSLAPWSVFLGRPARRRAVLILASVAMAVGMIGDGLSPDWQILLLARSVTGLEIGAVLPAGTSLIAELAPSRFRAALISVVVVSTTVGASSTAVGILWWLERLIATDLEGAFRRRVGRGSRLKQLLSIIPAIGTGLDVACSAARGET